MAAQSGHSPIVEYLARLAPDTLRTPSGRKHGLVIHLAAQMGATEAVSAVLSLDPECALIATNPDGALAIHLAAALGHTDTMLLLARAHPNSVAARTKQGCTPLHLASAYGHVDTTEQLIRLGSWAMRALTNDNSLPLHMAAELGQTQTLRLLLQAESDPVAAAMSRRQDGTTPLFLASMHGHADVVKELLAIAPTALTVASTAGQFPLHAAAERGKTRYISQSALKLCVWMRVFSVHLCVSFVVPVIYSFLLVACKVMPPLYKHC